MYYAKYVPSPIGTLLLVCDEDNLVEVRMEQQKHHAASLLDKDIAQAEYPLLDAATEWLEGYFAGKRPSVEALPLAPQGSAFQKAVWDILSGIPYGTYITYGDIAKTMARKLDKKKMASQAVGGAVGRNPLAIIIPCHRVVGAKGNLTGYAGGLGNKVKLLEHEGVDMSLLFMPSKGTAL